MHRWRQPRPAVSSPVAGRTHPGQTGAIYRQVTDRQSPSCADSTATVGPSVRPSKRSPHQRRSLLLALIIGRRSDGGVTATGSGRISQSPCDGR